MVGYTEETLQKALKMVREGTLNRKSASRIFNIPRQTIQYRLGSKFKKPGKGPSTTLSKTEEEVLVKWLKENARKGFPKREADLLDSVSDFIKQDGRINPFKDGRPGKKWVELFLARHPDISLRTPEEVTAASGNVSWKDIEKWFESVEKYLKEEGLFHILSKPERVFNGDETSLQLCPKTGKVLAAKGSKNVYEVDCAPAKSAVTVMFTFSGAGVYVPPMIIYPYLRLPREIIKSVPDDWSIGRSASGWMKAEDFHEYIGNTFIPFLEDKKIERPVILFVDGHKSHLTYNLSELCQKNGIILIALYPNATRILQPADVAVFRPIKQAWRKAVATWRSQNPNGEITKELVAPLLKTVLDVHVRPDILQNGFKACGLYPWNFHAIDLSKCLGHVNIPAPAPPQSDLKSVAESATPLKTLDFRRFRNMAGPSVMRKLTTGWIDKHQNNEFETLVKNIYDFFASKELSRAIEDSSSYTVLYESSEQTIETIEMPTPSGEELSRAIEDSSSYTVLYESSEQTIETIEMPTPSGEELSRAIEDSSSYTVLDESSEQTIETIEMPRPGEKVSLNEVVRWPDSPKRKGNRACARMPYVISSKQWKELYDERKKKKEAEEEEKNKRRIIREQNKQRRDEEANAKRMAKSKKMKTTIMTTKRLPPRDGEKENPKFLPPREANLENSKEEDTPINNSTRSLCFVCGGCTKQSDRIECEICDKLFHLKCVAVKENEVFVCDPCLKENELEL